MKKFLLYISISIFILNFLAPLGVSIIEYHKVSIDENIVSADYAGALQTFKDAVAKFETAAETYVHNTEAAKVPDLKAAYVYAYYKAIAAGNDAMSAASGTAQQNEVRNLINDAITRYQKIKQGISVVDINAQKNNTSDNNTYNLLAPIGDLTQVKSSNGIGDYLNKIFLIAIGLCGALAVIMLVIGGIQYMGNESVFGKTEAKSKMLSAILGLLIALGAYALLYTINPDLTGKNGVTVAQVNVGIIEEDAPEGGDLDEPLSESGPQPAIKCSNGAAQGFCMFGTYDNPKPTGEIPALVTALKSGYQLAQIDIYTNDRIFFTAKKGSDQKIFRTSGIGHGRNQFSEVGPSNLIASDSNKLKTPKGSWAVTSKRKAGNQNEVVRSRPKGFAMGAAAFVLNVDGRGIDIHGNRKNAPGTTAGCVLMYNDDLLALYPYINPGLKVTIGL